MPPRHTYWTIILEGKPTAFRAHTEEELLPTLKQLQARHPDAVLRWFARGRLWHSKEEERLAQLARRAKRENRGRDWRPGGTHRDPRERFDVPRDEKRRRFRERLQRDRREEGRTSPAGGGERARMRGGPPRGRGPGGPPRGGGGTGGERGRGRGPGRGGKGGGGGTTR